MKALCSRCNIQLHYDIVYLHLGTLGRKCFFNRLLFSFFFDIYYTKKQLLSCVCVNNSHASVERHPGIIYRNWIFKKGLKNSRTGEVGLISHYTNEIDANESYLRKGTINLLKFVEIQVFVRESSSAWKKESNCYGMYWIIIYIEAMNV